MLQSAPRGAEQNNVTFTVLSFVEGKKNRVISSHFVSLSYHEIRLGIGARGSVKAQYNFQRVLVLVGLCWVSTARVPIPQHFAIELVTPPRLWLYFLTGFDCTRIYFFIIDYAANSQGSISSAFALICLGAVKKLQYAAVLKAIWSAWRGMHL